MVWFNTDKLFLIYIERQYNLRLGEWIGGQKAPCLSLRFAIF